MVDVVRTALVRDFHGNLEVLSSIGFRNQAEFARDLRADGLKVLKVWNGHVDDKDIEYWYRLHRVS